MANIKQQKKRIGITLKQNAINRSRKTRVKNVIKEYDAIIVSGDIKAAEAKLPEVVSVITSSGIFHSRTASRKVAHYSKKLDTLRAAK